MSLQIFDVHEGQIDNKELSYQDLIDYMDEGYIHIPEFQRKFVWTKQKILELLDSIYRGYPVGSLIFWVTERPFDHSSAIGQSETDSFINARLFVIDGQQRLKSLYHAAKRKKLKMKREQSNKSVTKEIDILFDLEKERFVFREDLLKNKRRSMFPIPEIKDLDLIFYALKEANGDNLEKMRERYELPKKSFNRFIWSLHQLGLVTEDSEEENSLTELGKQVLEGEDNERIAILLADNSQFIKETLQIIKNNPGITRKEAAPKFQEYYGKSENTARYQFGRRCRWLRALKVIKKNNGEYFLTESGGRFLKDLILTEKEQKLRTVPLEKILSGSQESDLIKNLDYLKQFPEEKQNKISELWEKFNQYEFSIIVVNKSDWEEVCEIFERINTQGQHLTVVDLMIAKTWSADKFNLREELRKFKEEIGEEDLPDITLLQALSLNLSGKCRRSDILSLDSREVRKKWDNVLESMRRSIDFFKDNLNLPGLDLIPFPALLVPVSKFFYHIGHGEPSKAKTEKIKRWFWKASIANRFDSAVETKLEDDGQKMLQIMDNEPVDFQYSYVPRNIEDIINQKHSLRNAFTKTILCLFASQKPLNPISNTPVTGESFSRYTKSQMHHIFPQNYLQKRGTDNDLINSIVNIMFLPANINNQGSFKKSPGRYLDEIDNPELEKALESHLIFDLEESGLLEDDFHKFLDYRARQILNTLEEVSGEEKISAVGRSLTPETPFTNEMHLREIIRQCNSYIHWFDKYFTRRGLEFLIEEANLENVSEIQIISGPAQTNHKLRKDFKKFQQEMGNKGVSAQMRIMSGKKLHDIHDRWLISENHAFNIPSINTIGQNQYAEITESPSKPPFSEWWSEGVDIVQDWKQVQKVLSK